MSSLPAFLAIVSALFLALIACFMIGRYLGGRRKADEASASNVGVSAIDGAVFGLMGLLIAFTFSGAALRFDHRRDLIVEEANAIGTAYLRLDLMPPAEQRELRQDFRDYVDARLSFYENLSVDRTKVQQDTQRFETLQTAIWKEAIGGCAEVNSPATTQLVLSSLNEMFDVTTKRSIAIETHPPVMIYMVLGILLLGSALLAGYEMAGAGAFSVLHMLVYAMILAIVSYLILDLEFPRLGIIRIDAVDHALVHVRQSMK